MRLLVGEVMSKEQHAGVQEYREQEHALWKKPCIWSACRSTVRIRWAPARGCEEQQNAAQHHQLHQQQIAATPVPVTEAAAKLQYNNISSSTTTITNNNNFITNSEVFRLTEAHPLIRSAARRPRRQWARVALSA
jgi:hypothetical protein